jgi:hypothetical protein
VRGAPLLLAVAAWASSGAQGAQVIDTVGSAAPRICRTGPVEMIVGGASRGADGACVGTPAGAADRRDANSADTRARVAPAAQRERDAERLAILQDELAKEQARMRTLDAAKASDDPDGAARRVRTRDDIDALQHEIARLR